MSVPAANAVSPAPVSTSALTFRSVSTCPQISASRSYIAKVSALRDAGRLNVMKPTPSTVLYRRSSIEVIFALAAGLSGRRGKRRAPVHPRPCCLKGCGHLQQAQILETATNDLQPDRQPVTRKAAGDGRRRATRQVEGVRKLRPG